MAEEDGVTSAGHVSVTKKDGVTVGDLRLLLEALDTSPLPDTAEVRVNTMWSTSAFGSKVRKITIVVPQ